MSLSKYYIEYNKILLFTFICCLHIFIAQYSIVSGLVAYLELFICLYTFFQRKTENYLLLITIFLVTSFDVSSFVINDRVVYSIANLPFLKTYCFLFLSLLPLITIILKLKNKRYKINIGKLGSEKILLYFSLTATFIGLVIGFFGFFINEIANLEFKFYYFFTDFYKLTLTNLYILYFIYFLHSRPTFYNKLRQVLFSLVISVIFSSIVSALFGKTGFYGDEPIILVPLSLFYTITIFLFLFYKEAPSKYIIFFLFLLSLFVQVTYSNALGGKSWLVVGYILLVSIIVLFQNKKSKLLIFYLSIAVILSFSVNTLLENRKSVDDLSASKLLQASLLVSVLDVDWYEVMPASPKMRIEEFLNISLEYYYKPYYSILGKGFGGGIQDHRNEFGYYNEFAFSDDQYAYRYFILMHETINVIFLKYGIWGILMLFLIIKKSIKNFYITPWLPIGVIWIIFFYGYSFTLTLFGIPSLVIGFYEIDYYKKKT